MRPATNTIFHRLPALASVVAALSLPASAGAAPGGVPVSPAAPVTAEQLDAAGVHEIIVKHAAGLDAGEREQVRAGADVTYQRSLTLPDTEVVKVVPGRLEAALNALRADPSVVYAEPDAPVHAFTGDPYWADQWALENTGQRLDYVGAPGGGTQGADIAAPEAWAEHTTGGGQVVAVVDSGVNSAANPDLLGQMAASPAGHDWVDNDGNPDDADGHGSHVAGIIAARQNNGAGISGVAPSATLVSLRVLDATGSGTDDGVASAFQYAGEHGVRIVNASLGSPARSTAERDAIVAHPETLFVVAAGNDAANNDVTSVYPCNEPEANVICVGATDPSDDPAQFSNYGAATVDLFAPGVDILSSWQAVDFGWYFLDGTSMATPHVAATLALMRTAAPALTAGELKQALLSSVDVLPQLQNKSVSGGRLNAAKAVAAARLLESQHHAGADTDGDGVADLADNCAPVSNHGQADSNADGIGDACDPAPVPAAATPSPPAPVAPPAATVTAPPVTTAPTASTTTTAPAVPVLGTLTTSAGARTVRICPAGGHGCRRETLTVAFRLDRTAKVTAQVQRRVCTGAHCRYATAATVRVTARPGANKLTIGASGATAKLKAGAYRLRVVASGAGTTSAARTLSFRVR